MLTIKEQVLAEAKRETNGCWTFKNNNAQVWRNRAAMFERQGRQTEAHEAYVIASYLEEVATEGERQWWETNGDRVLHIVAAMVTGRPQKDGVEDLIATAAQIVRTVTDRAAHAQIVGENRAQPGPVWGPDKPWKTKESYENAVQAFFAMAEQRRLAQSS